MYIRQISRKNKNGTITRYVQLAHNERNPVTGTPQAKVLYHFGRADELDTEGLKRLAASIHRFIGEPLPSGSEQTRSASVTMLKSKSLDGTWLLDQLWKKLGIGQAIARRLADREFRMPVERAIFAMVANRVLDPSSKLCQRTELTEEHRAIVSALKIEEPQQIWDISLLLTPEICRHHTKLSTTAEFLVLLGSRRFVHLRTVEAGLHLHYQ